MKISLWIPLLLLAASTAFGASLSDILGIWKTEMDESKVKIFPCGENVCGTIVWLKNPNYLDSSDGKVGTPIIDQHNPDPSLRSRPLIGLRILEGFTPEGNNSWGNGTCYDPKSGKSYRASLRLNRDGSLRVTGCVLFICQSVRWTRSR